MTRLTLLAVLLLTSCGTPDAKEPVALPVCPAVDPGPPPELHPAQGDGKVELPDADAVALGHWIREVMRFRESVLACPAVRPIKSALSDVTVDLTEYDPLDVNFLIGLGLPQALESVQFPEIEEVSFFITGCGQINAMYGSLDGERAILVCWEMIRLARGLDAPGAVLFAAYHEVAHAMLDGKHPVGNEEIAADQFAAVMLILSGRASAVADAATMWEFLGSLDNYQDAEHPPPTWRANRMRCLLHGSGRSDQKLGWNGLRCQRAWRDAVGAWGRFLDER